MNRGAQGFGYQQISGTDPIRFTPCWDHSFKSKAKSTSLNNSFPNFMEQNVTSRLKKYLLDCSLLK